MFPNEMVHNASPYVTYTNTAKCNVVVGELFVRSQHHFAMRHINKGGGVAAPESGVLAGEKRLFSSFSLL